MQVKAGDILSAYITAPVKEKVWTILGPEFGNNSGKSAIIVHALYGLKSAGASFQTHRASFMHQMGYTSCKADPDLWFKAETQPDNSVLFYAYILCYVDNILCIHHDALSVLTQINDYLPLKPTSVGGPDIYRGAKLKETQLLNGIYAWGMSPSKYVNQADKNCQTYLSDKLNDKYKIPTRADNPFPTNYCPDIDATAPLDPGCLSFYQHLIGVMRWMVKLGRVDVATKVSMLLSYLVCPREGHLEAAIHAMGYL